MSEQAKVTSLDALDGLCRRRGWHRLAGLHCYDLYGGADPVSRLFDVPSSLGTQVVFDQSVFVKNAIETLLHEGAIG